jgi:hypothetical protein
MDTPPAAKHDENSPPPPASNPASTPNPLLWDAEEKTIAAKPGDSIGEFEFTAINTFDLPYLEIKNTSAKVEHEASTSKIGEDQIFYCRQRGISMEDAVNMIVSGFCKEVFRELPMEFAVEAQKLLSVSLEGSVG